MIIWDVSLFIKEFIKRLEKKLERKFMLMPPGRPKKKERK